jgi:hypothetical protein
MLLALVLAAAHTFQADPFDGGLPPTVWAFEAKLLVPELDGGTAWVPSTCYPVEDGGSECAGGWQPEPRLEAFGRSDTDLRVQNAQLRATPPLFSKATWAALGVCAAIFLLGGLVLGFEVDRLLPGR